MGALESRVKTLESQNAKLEADLTTFKVQYSHHTHEFKQLSGWSTISGPSLVEGAVSSQNQQQMANQLIAIQAKLGHVLIPYVNDQTNPNSAMVATGGPK